MKELILGGARSGKSHFAENCAKQSGLTVIYIATATTDDDEMVERVRLHQAERPEHWSLVEEPLVLAETLKKHASSQSCLIVDCLTLWLSNLLLQTDEPFLEKEINDLLAIVSELPGHIVFVSNEVGCGIVPENALARKFRDEAGRLNQRMASVCDRVTFVAAGLPLIMKGNNA